MARAPRKPRDPNTPPPTPPALYIAYKTGDDGELEVFVTRRSKELLDKLSKGGDFAGGDYMTFQIR